MLEPVELESRKLVQKREAAKISGVIICKHCLSLCSQRTVCSKCPQRTVCSKFNSTSILDLNQPVMASSLYLPIHGYT